MQPAAVDNQLSRGYCDPSAGDGGYNIRIINTHRQRLKQVDGKFSSTG